MAYKTKIIKIGKSQGIRIPKALLEEMGAKACGCAPNNGIKKYGAQKNAAHPSTDDQYLFISNSKRGARTNIVDLKIVCV